MPPHPDLDALLAVLVEDWRALGPDRAPLWVTEHPPGDDVDADPLTVGRAWLVVPGGPVQAVSAGEAAAVLRVHFGGVAAPGGRAPLPVAWGTVAATGVPGEYAATLRWAGLGGWGRRYRVVGGRTELVATVWVS